MANSILIFPCGMPQSIAFLNQSLANGLKVVGASSLNYDPDAHMYPEWAFLPYVTDPTFSSALKDLIDLYDIHAIFSPNIVVWQVIHELCSAESKIRLLNPNPYDEQIRPYHAALQLAGSIIDDNANYGDISIQNLSPTLFQIASLIHHSSHISGMCDDVKLTALCNVFPCVPPGDIVEIGVWQGKSAFIMLILSRLYNAGTVLCVDPWSSEEIIQPDSSDIVNKASYALNVSDAFMAFKLNMIPYVNGNFNYIRATSADACLCYSKANEIFSPEFGSTALHGSISLLHIDGNHSYDAVSRDIKLWQQNVVSKGWIIFDDYLWVYGQGPKTAADEFLKEHSSSIRTAFVAGGALFIQLI